MDTFKEIERQLRHHKLGQLVAEPQLLQGDGSERRFFRLALNSEATVIAVLPPSSSAGSFSSEAASSAAINRHLAERGVAVPRLLAFVPESGLLLYEDAGDIHLSEFALNCLNNEDRLEGLYRPVIDALLHMQIRGGEGFTNSLCWDAPHYDRETMLVREGLYFLDSFCLNYCGVEIDKQGLITEIERIINAIEKISEKQREFFLHRDFQSRNIMVLADGSFRIIDYQAGRSGPLAYDLASLLIDPYVSLPHALQQKLLDYYCLQLEQRFGLDSSLLRISYGQLACMRNMQVLGAFSFLYLQKKKAFFKQFIPTALRALNRRLREEWAVDLPGLRDLVKVLLEQRVKG